MINNYKIDDFMLSDPKKVPEKKFFHLDMPIHFLIKHRNAGKIDSHKWFFKGFCDYMQPEYTQIIDCGSIPLWSSISYLIKYMDKFEKVGGCSGEIEVSLPERDPETNKEYSFTESILLRSQYVEYKISHYLDKAMETSFGFVSVLPGAFSTFRWKAIKGTPLKKFLLGARDEFSDQIDIPSCATANKNLAEDRIMCIETIVQKNHDWTLAYVPNAICLTDPPITLMGILKQRRRWFNGTLFSTFSVIGSMWRVLQRKGS